MNAVSYDVQVSSDTNCINILTSGNTTDEIINFTGMEPGTTYFWRVRGKINNQNAGPWSNVWRFSTEPNLTSLSNMAPLSSVYFYPNPANEELNIDCLTNSDIKIYSNKGELLYSNETQSGTLQINTSNFTSGLYTLLIKTNSQYQSFKIVIQH
ncbi:MAG TPA: T9SS type A sorting domain-containing protein [Bacteroidia bacterium]